MNIQPLKKPSEARFMPSATSFEPESETLQTSYARKPFALIIILWFALIFLYIQFSFGWDSLAALLPSEFAAFLAAVFIPPAILLLLTALISRTVTATHQAYTVEKSLKRFLLGSDEQALSEVISRTLRKEIAQLTDSADFLSKQTGVLQNEINAKSAEFAQSIEVFEGFLNNGLKKLEKTSNLFAQSCAVASSKADESASLYLQRIEALKDTTRLLNRELEPLLNETLSTTEQLQHILDESKEHIKNQKSQTLAFRAQTFENMESLAHAFQEQADKLEKTYRRTADNCQEVFKKLDKGVAHIEESLRNHRALADQQNHLLHENSGNVESRLTEYGRLINMEAKAMLERSNNMDKNLKNQIHLLDSAGARLSQILDGTNNSLEQKSGRVARNIDKIIASLQAELEKLSGFIHYTEDRNEQIHQAAEKISGRISGISDDMAQKADDIKSRSIEAIDKFNEASGIMSQNALNLTETANLLTAKGREGIATLETQTAAITRTASEMQRLEKQITTLGETLQNVANQTSLVLDNYQNQTEQLSTDLYQRAEKLDVNRLRQEQQIKDFQKTLDDADVRNFIAQSGQMVENLENLAVDFNRFFNEDNDDLWKKFYGGDHGIFARYVTKNLKRAQVIKIRQSYEKDTDFRLIADRYMSEFEQLLQAAEKTEKSPSLLAVLSSSDIGKIYYVVARALGRLE